MHDESWIDPSEPFGSLSLKGRNDNDSCDDSMNSVLKLLTLNKERTKLRKSALKPLEKKMIMN